MTPQETLSWIERVSAGIAKGKRVPKPQVKFWDKRSRPLRYKWQKLPTCHTGYETFKDDAH